MIQAFHISNIYFRYLIFTDIPVVFHGSAAGISVDINPAASEKPKLYAILVLLSVIGLMQEHAANIPSAVK